MRNNGVGGANAFGESETSEIIYPVKGRGQRTIADRFAIPHTFPPELTITQALVRVGGALMRICLGSLLFALWGVGSLMVWSAVANPFLRVLALLPLLAVFLATATGVMLGVTAVVKWLSPHAS
jgi:hypothetical protein